MVSGEIQSMADGKPHKLVCPGSNPGLAPIQPTVKKKLTVEKILQLRIKKKDTLSLSQQTLSRYASAIIDAVCCN
jgi:hypothetical protein